MTDTDAKDIIFSFSNNNHENEDFSALNIFSILDRDQRTVTTKRLKGQRRGQTKN